MAEPEEPLLPPVTPLLTPTPGGPSGQARWTWLERRPLRTHHTHGRPAQHAPGTSEPAGGEAQVPLSHGPRGLSTSRPQPTPLNTHPRCVLSRPTRHPRLPASSAQYPSSPLGDLGRETRSPLFPADPRPLKTAHRHCGPAEAAETAFPAPTPAPAWGREHRTPAVGTDPESQLPASSAPTSRSPAPAPSQAKYGRLPHCQSPHLSSPPWSGSR